MPQKLPLNGFKWLGNLSEFDKYFIKNVNEKSDEIYFAELDVPYPEKLYDFHSDLLFLPERTKIGKVEELAANLNNKN